MSLLLSKLKYRLGIYKRRRYKHIYISRKQKRKCKLCCIAVLSAAVVFYTLFRIENRINPLIYDMSLSALNSIVLKECNTAVIELTESEDICYDELMNRSYDVGGNLKSISVNYKNMNLFKSKLAIDVQNRIDNINQVEVEIPIMSMFTDRFYSAVGLPVKIKVMTDENVSVEFKDEFVSVGINQTKHIIYVKITADFGVNIPIRGNGDSIETEIPIAETVIVGSVPDTYLSLE